MHRNRFAKIVATLGPASSSLEMIEALFVAGVDVFRLNFSHGERAIHEQNVAYIRTVEQKYQRPIAILMDLQGPKFRIGRFTNTTEALTPEQAFVFDKNEALGDNTRVYLPHPEFFSAAKPGHRLLIDDARVAFEVIANDGEKITAKLIYGKSLSNNKGINFPDTVLDVPVLTEKDESDLDYGLTLGVDYVALSFVQRAADMAYLRERVGKRAAILAKIEKPSAVTDLENILKASDAIMLARGDLGVEFPPEKLPSIQKQVIKTARAVGKPVIVATQMLESMISNAVATRAEATDVDAAISEGADAVMLSGETAMGQYPIESVSFMNRLIIESEKDSRYVESMTHYEHHLSYTSEGAIAQGVKAVVNAVPIAAIACFTASGGTAIRLSRERALTPLIAMTNEIDSARRLQLYWGIDANVGEDITKFKTVMAAAAETVLKRGYGKQGDWIVVTAGVPFGRPGTTNTLRLLQLGEDLEA